MKEILEILYVIITILKTFGLWLSAYLVSMRL
jgi:hypothetical protein